MYGDKNQKYLINCFTARWSLFCKNPTGHAFSLTGQVTTKVVIKKLPNFPLPIWPL